MAHIDTIYVMLIPIWLYLIINLLWSQKQAGKLLLNLGEDKRALQLNLGMFLAAVMIFPVITSVVNSQTFGREELLQTISSVLGAGWFLLFGFKNRLSLTEKGILSSTGLTKWKQIQSHKWENSLLVVKVKTYFGTIGLRLPISPNQKQDANNVLLNYLHNNYKS
jgi:Domain of unknown function (DUF5673)